MPKADNRSVRRRLANAYLSSVISISLVLLLIGLATLLIANAGNVADYFKENMQVSVIFKAGTGEEQAAEYGSRVGALPFVRSVRVVSREEGTAELKEMLGEDFLDIFETSPVPVSLELSLIAGYVAPDSLAKVLPLLEDHPLVDEVSCRQSLVEALNANLARISLVLSVFIALLLFISFVLINNTVRINVFSRRFTIHTMKMVGATRSFISAPFLKAALLQGLASALIAILALSGMVLALRNSFAQLFEVFTTGALALTAGTVVLCGVVICTVSTRFVVGKLVSMDKDDLYY